jgi:hypothetical protein
MAIKGDTIYLKGNNEALVKIIKFAPPKISQFQAQPINAPPVTNLQAQQSNLNQQSNFGQQSNLNQTAQNTVAMSNLVQSQMVANQNPARYNNFTASKIEFDVTGTLEKVALSKTGKLIYAGGSIGMNLLKYENESRKYLQVKNNVARSEPVAAQHQGLRSEVLAERAPDLPRSHVERPGGLQLHRHRSSPLPRLDQVQLP